MKQIEITYVEDKGLLLAHLFLQLDNLTRHQISHVPWSSYPYKPEVPLFIAYNNKNIFLKYFVKEKSIRAASENFNGPVWEDSCVEFFISFDEKGYLEFNCLRVALNGIGMERVHRWLISAEVVSILESKSTIQKAKDNLIQWELMLSIPLNIYVYHSLSSIQDKQGQANFYKCDDLLSEPHFLAWSEISSNEPNFHQPHFFSTLSFV